MCGFVGACQSFYFGHEIMRLKTYPRLNLPSKRLGIEVDDWLWIGIGMLPGLLAQSVMVFLAGPLLVAIWAAFIKPTKTRGWLQGVIEYLFSHGLGLRKYFYKAGLEGKKG